LEGVGQYDQVMTIKEAKKTEGVSSHINSGFPNIVCLDQLFEVFSVRTKSPYFESSAGRLLSFFSDAKHIGSIIQVLQPAGLLIRDFFGILTNLSGPR
jgi:hypothetical protein